MNRLKKETSPYLQQHANNPVDWYAWKPEAFQKAIEEDKPILVSIGYSTCHWCHVMEHESFEDPAIAAYMNAHFVSIKVDREERPDVDQIYMEACQVISGSGGWPLNVFCTPDGKPFYAGTYFPPKGHLNRSSWIQVLHSIERSFREKRNVIEEQAQRLIEIIEKSGARFLDYELLEKDAPFTNDDLHTMFQGLVDRFDTKYGGFGTAPKFPQVSNLEFLRVYGLKFGAEQATAHLRLSLDKMIRGGMYDHLGGGFMRYSTDQLWLVPHFEKMLYDNALLLRLLAKVWATSRDPLYLQVIEQTVTYIAREMTGPDGGFYSALDADSEGEEGAFYVWTWAEMESLFGADTPMIASYFDMTVGGNWEGKNIVWRLNADPAFAETQGISIEEWQAKLDAAQAKMFEKRALRIRPGLDDKYLLDWNALLLSGLIEVYLATGLETAKALAVNNLTFLQKTFAGPEPVDLKHVYSDKSSEGAFYAAFLDDYAYFIEALILAYQIDFDPELILQASRYSDYLLDNFVEPKTDLFYFTSGKEKDLPVRKMDIFDSSSPSGNSVMVRNLLRLELLMGGSKYRLHAESMLKRVLDSLKKYPTALCNWGIGLSEIASSFRAIVIIGPNAKAFARKIQQENIEQSILVATISGIADFPITENRDSGDGKTWIYLCQDYACQKPVETIEAFLELI